VPLIQGTAPCRSQLAYDVQRLATVLRSAMDPFGRTPSSPTRFLRTATFSGQRRARTRRLRAHRPPSLRHAAGHRRTRPPPASSPKSPCKRPVLCRSRRPRRLLRDRQALVHDSFIAAEGVNCCKKKPCKTPPFLLSPSLSRSRPLVDPSTPSLRPRSVQKIPANPRSRRPDSNRGPLHYEL
jgi:hypothetical protein